MEKVLKLIEELLEIIGIMDNPVAKQAAVDALHDAAHSQDVQPTPQAPAQGTPTPLADTEPKS